MANIRLTSGRIASFTCPAGKQQAFLRDAEQPGFGVRVTAAGTKAYIFQGKLEGRVIRMTIGDLQTWALGDARKEARRLKTIIDRGHDPREEKAAITAADVAKRIATEEAKVQTLEKLLFAYCDHLKILKA